MSKIKVKPYFLKETPVSANGITYIAGGHSRSSKLCKNDDDLILGVDLGGTKILTVLTNPHGKMLSCDHSITPAKKDRKAIIQSILQSESHYEDLKNTMAKGGRVMVRE